MGVKESKDGGSEAREVESVEGRGKGANKRRGER